MAPRKPASYAPAMPLPSRGAVPAFDPSGPSLPGGIFGLPHSPEDAAVVLVPVAWEATTSYRRGTAAAPEAIVRASAQVDLHDLECGEPFSAGIAMLPPDPAIAARHAEAAEAGLAVIAAWSRGEEPPADTLACTNRHTAWLNEWVRAEVTRWLGRDKLVGVVGGDHGVSFGAVAACVEHFGSIGLLHIDAHADLRERYEGFSDSHASIMHNVMTKLPAVERLVQVGVRDLCAEELAFIADSAGRVVSFFDRDLAAASFRGEPFAAVCERIVAALPRQVYVSFDIDGLDPSLCPHTGTPVPGGLGFREAVFLLGALVDSGRRIVGFDLVEVAPGPGDDEWDCNVAARLLYKLVGFALRSWTRGR